MTTYSSMEEIFIINQLMTWWNIMMKSGKSQLVKMMIIQLVVYWIILISKIITN